MTIRIYLDANVFIDAFENDDVAVTRGRSVLVAELLTKPLETGDNELCEAYEALFDSSSTIEAFPIDRTMLMKAAKLRATAKSMKMPDAIHVATAILRDCVAFVTADRRLSVPNGMRMINLDASTVDQLRALA